MKNLLFLMALCGLFVASCEGCKNDCPDQLEFYLPLQAYGIKDTLYLGDTLRIRLDIPDKLAEINSGYVYDFLDYDFKLITYIGKIDTFPTGTNSAETFNWIIQQGESISDGEIFRILPVYSDHAYHYEVIVTPKRKGLFVFGMNTVADRADKLKELDGPCSRKPTYVYPKLENDSNVNFEFLKLSPEPSQANTDRERFDRYAGFCFFVK